MPPHACASRYTPATRNSHHCAMAVLDSHPLGDSHSGPGCVCFSRASRRCRISTVHVASVCVRRESELQTTRGLPLRARSQADSPKVRCPPRTCRPLASRTPPISARAPARVLYTSHGAPPPADIRRSSLLTPCIRQCRLGARCPHELRMRRTRSRRVPPWLSSNARQNHPLDSLSILESGDLMLMQSATRSECA